MRESPLSDRVALVTGGGSGIGEATVRALAGAGAAIAVLDRDADGAKRVVSAVIGGGGTASAFVVDLAETASIPGAVEQVLSAYGRIDILVNAAGVAGGQAAILDVAEEDWDHVQTVNLKAPFLLLQQVARHMVERGGGGRIVNISSSSAFRGRSSGAAYGSSKAALCQLTRSAAADLGAHDINVNAVAPGVTATPMTSGIDPKIMEQMITEGPLANLLGRVSLPEDVADAVLYLCLPGSRQITGQTLHTSAGAVL